jgi:hypothetical protein
MYSEVMCFSIREGYSRDNKHSWAWANLRLIVMGCGHYIYVRMSISSKRRRLKKIVYFQNVSETLTEKLDPSPVPLSQYDRPTSAKPMLISKAALEILKRQLEE